MPEGLPDAVDAFLKRIEGVSPVQEVSAGHQQVRRAPHVFDPHADNVEAFDQWRFARFVVPPPAATIREKQGKKL